ncbi:MAG: phosphate ABC transporter permease subunit PstC [Candidatus Anoxymicrobium japonicum]|uniref:Phosphate transport system permease protein n=1 Tax=Candidatus Anoxymicrobium japonicum TaxID=2013648 RepID=A0A2N3G6J0_9ACTN|nr:MAG: phosphate ABC transporter permease subunit PstC [Candidatus Anoxymicrobium japonicum]
MSHEGSRAGKTTVTKAIAIGDRDRLIKFVMFACASLSFFAILIIILFIFRKSLPAIKELGIGDLFLSTRWSPKTGHYGMLAFTWGTLLTTTFAMLLAAPLGISTAVFVEQIAPVRMGKLVRRGIELLAGVPSVVIGWFALTMLVPLIRGMTASAGFGIMAASLVLVVMSLPTITTLSVEAMRAVPPELREASVAMGATRWQTIYKVLLPSAREGLIIAIILGMGRAIGETMAVQMVIGNARGVAFSPFARTSTLTTRIVTDMGEATGVFRSALFAQALMLLLLAVFLIACVRLIGRRRGVAS